MNTFNKIINSIKDFNFKISNSFIFRKNIAVSSKIINSGAVSFGKKFSAGYNSIIWADGKYIKFGDNCHIHPNVFMRLYGGFIETGSNVYINPFTIIYGHGGVKIGDNVLIAGHTMIIPSSHNYISKKELIIEQLETSKGIIIGSDVWIGAHCVIMDGVEIGTGCVIGAGSVVNKSTEPYCVYAGTPAKKIKKRI
ncbi:MAG TPA: acyltransferase [bacterium]|nr:acyltransferase [bacterium]